MNYKSSIYNDLMRQISKDVKYALNENFNFEHNEVGDFLVELINKNENIKNVVVDATCDEWTELIDTIVSMKNNMPNRCPARITNMNALACFIIKGLGSRVNALFNYNDDEKSELADYMCEQFSASSGPNKELYGCGGKNKDSKGKPAINSCNDNDDCFDEKDKLNDCCGKNRHVKGKTQISENTPRYGHPRRRY